MNLFQRRFKREVDAMESQVTSESVQKTFITAVLLTGSSERAEAATLEGIRALDSGAASNDALLRNTLTAAIRMETPLAHERPEELEKAASWLPVELQRILRLSRIDRQCYVLRLLASMARESVARLLDLDVTQVDLAVCHAAQALTRFVSQRESGMRAPDFAMAGSRQPDTSIWLLPGKQKRVAENYPMS